jgi:hypothetical protein
MRHDPDRLERSKVRVARIRGAAGCHALYGEGTARVQAAREILDRGYGKVPEAAAEPSPTVIKGIGIEPFRKPKENEGGSETADPARGLPAVLASERGDLPGPS